MQRAGYQLLGFAVWKSAKRYLRFRFGDLRRRLALALLGVVVIAALVAAGRRRRSDEVT